jgi:hypothetical protein
MATKAVAVKEESNTALAVQTDFSGFEAYAGIGMEEVRAEDQSLPFLRILAQLSPQVNKRDGAYVQGAEPGMIHDNLTNDVYDGEQGILVVPCHYSPTLVEWVPKNQGGGFRGTYAASDPIKATTHKNDLGKDILPNGNELVDTSNFFVLQMGEDGVPRRRLITMTSTQQKKARKWVSVMGEQYARRADGSSFVLPYAANIYRLRTVEEKNDKGSWFGWDISRVRTLNLADPTERSYLEMGVAFAKQVKAGEVEVKHTRDDEVSSGSQGPGRGFGSDDEAPF